MTRKSGSSGKPERKRSPAQEATLEKHRWREGYCPNPSGRPKKNTHLVAPPGEEAVLAAQMIVAEALEYVPVNRDGKTVKIPRLDAMRRKEFATVMAGGKSNFTPYLNSYLQATKIIQQHRATKRAELAEFEKVNRHWAELWDQHEAMGEPPPFECHYDPRDITVNLDTLEITCCGPQSDEEREEWEQFRQNREAFMVDIEKTQKLLDKERDPWSIEFFEEEIEESKWLLTYLDGFYPSAEMRRRPGFSLAGSRNKMAREMVLNRACRKAKDKAQAPA